MPLGKIEYVSMKRPRDKEARMAAVMALKEDRLERKKENKRLDPFASTTNKVRKDAPAFRKNTDQMAEWVK